MAPLATLLVNIYDAHRIPFALTGEVSCRRYVLGRATRLTQKFTQPPVDIDVKNDLGKETRRSRSADVDLSRLPRQHDSDLGEGAKSW